MDEGLSIATGVREGFQIVVVRGELDELAAPELERAIDGCRQGWPVIVDLSGVEFISSAGIHTLLRDRSQHLTLVGAPPSIARLFAIVEPRRCTGISDDLDTAIEHQVNAWKHRPRFGTLSGR